jgi:chlorite dismutase
MTLRTVARVLVMAVSALAAASAGAADRQKLLSEPGVYATFGAFKIDGEWWKLDKTAREAGAAAVKAVLQKHAETVAADVFLLRGLSDGADLLVRLHATEMVHNQNLLLDLLATPLGRQLKTTTILNGMTKPANYVPAFPDEMKAALKAPSDPGAKPYAIVIPIRKDAEWWAADKAARIAMMQEHTQASLPYLKTVKRKLYHSSGLDDFDFITYFETTRLDDFNNLIIALESVKENRHNKRFGHPTLVGTLRPLEEILEILTQ